MFSIFKKNPVKKLSKLYESKLEEAMNAQRRGDIRAYSMITAEAEDIRAEVLKLQAQTNSKLD